MTAFITNNPPVAEAANAMIPLKRMARPEEIGGSAVRGLASSLRPDAAVERCLVRVTEGNEPLPRPRRAV